MAILERTADMKPPLGFNVGGVRFFWGCVCPKTDQNTVYSDECSPIVAAWMSMRTKRGGIVLANPSAENIFAINAMWNISQVAKTVVRAIAVFVVNLVNWPFANDIKPSQPVRSVIASVNLNDDEATRLDGSCDRASGGTSSCAASYKKTGYGIVFKQVTQTLRAKIDSNHDALLKLIGQRLTTIHGRLSASLF